MNEMEERARHMTELRMEGRWNAQGERQRNMKRGRDGRYREGERNVWRHGGRKATRDGMK